MFILTSQDRLTITTHSTNTWDLATFVKDYIESRHNCSINIKEIEGQVYYDCPGPRFIMKELYEYVNIGKVETRIDDVDMLICYFNKTPDFTKGFMRIPSFYTHICLTEQEFNETKLFIQNNETIINAYIKKANDIIDKHMKKVKNGNN